MKDLMKELRVVREEVFREYQKLKILEQTNSSNKNSNNNNNNDEKRMILLNNRKRKRLIYLFVKDLSRGVSGEVLSNKSQRESQMSKSTINIRVISSPISR